MNRGFKTVQNELKGLMALNENTKTGLKLIRKLGYKINDSSASHSVLSFVLSVHSLVSKLESR